MGISVYKHILIHPTPYCPSDGHFEGGQYGQYDHMGNMLGNHPNLILKVMEIETEQVGKPCVVAHDELNLVLIV